MAAKLYGRLDPGEEVEFYADAEQERPYFVGVVTRSLATINERRVAIEATPPEPVVEVEEPLPEPGDGFPRPKGWT
jgi:hypothetical protein